MPARERGDWDQHRCVTTSPKGSTPPNPSQAWVTWVTWWPHRHGPVSSQLCPAQPQAAHLQPLLVAVGLPCDLHVHCAPLPRLLRRQQLLSGASSPQYPRVLGSQGTQGLPIGIQSPPGRGLTPAHTHPDCCAVRLRHLWPTEELVLGGARLQPSPGEGGDTAQGGRDRWVAATYPRALR